ncbi:hypothetical protein C8R47DRAFT_973734 [Mycena vitilis]|nr:hypothetical protein C8R47DRAFT_973734 [Mycena vitilis]
MPVQSLRTHKAEARYNVTTECKYSLPSLGLHSAAATGNIGLVEYALARGQPINSVLDGVLPLHAAAAGGNEAVVQLLIERGADVNAPRLPRRYSNDKNRDTSAPIVGTSGSTPLHFAAANGNTSIVNNLLLRGAHANRADKHGITPEMLARQNGWDETAQLIKTWMLNKDRDLRERAGPPEPDDQGGVPLSRFASRDRDGSIGENESSTRRRIHMKRSMDTALSMLKGSSECLKPPVPSASTSNLPANTSTLTPPASPMKPFGEYTFYPTSPSPIPIDPGTRRPSLPQISYPAPPPAVNRKTSLTTRGNPRRPRSAGTGADADAEGQPRGSTGRRLGSKYSLLNMFKKEGSPAGVPSGSALGLRGSTSAGSLSRLRNEATGDGREMPDSAPAAVQDFDLDALEKTFLEDDDEDEYAYGRPLPNSRLGILSKAARSPPADKRPRGLSLTSSSQSSLSPAAVDPAHTEFPFSINEPPPIAVGAKSPHRLSPLPLDNRGRGDSVSSTSTTESQINPQMSASGTTSGSGSVTVTTPLQAPEVLAVSPQGSPLPMQVQLEGEAGGGEVQVGPKLLTPNRLNERRTHTPVDINLSLISSHAQAEALVQKELQDILEMPVAPDAKAAGWTPLSARLAAYGESLELERKFRSDLTPPADDETPTITRPLMSGRSDQSLGQRRSRVDRQNSLDIKPTSARRRPKEPRRPHTSSGTDSPSAECKFHFPKSRFYAC